MPGRLTSTMVNITPFIHLVKAWLLYPPAFRFCHVYERHRGERGADLRPYHEHDPLPLPSSAHRYLADPSH